MSLTTVVKQRRIQGQKAAEGQYIDLLDDVDDIEKLLEAYLSLRDEEYTPAVQPDPLTTEVFKDYVRRIHDAIRSTDEAVDAFNTAKDGSLLNTPVMNYVDSVGMFEAQLIAGKLVKTVHRVQCGTVSIPSWPVLTGLKLHIYKTFEDRMDKVLRTLTTRKSVCKALFFEEVSMVTRVSMQPEEEASKKGSNNRSNQKRSNQVVFAKDNMPKDEEADTATPGTGDGDRQEGADHENTDKDMAPPPTKKTRRAPRTRTPASEAVTINPGGRRGKKPTATPSAEEDIDDSASTQPDTPAASTPSNTGASSTSQPAFSSAAQPSHNTGISFTPINAGSSNQRASVAASASNNDGRPVSIAPSAPSSPMQTDGPVQPATPGAVRYGTPKQTNVTAFPVMVDHGPALRTALAALPKGKGKLYGNRKFPGPLGKPLAQYGDPNPLPPGQRLLPQQPQQAQSPRQGLLQQYHSPSNNMNTEQGLSYGFQQSSPPSYSLSQEEEHLRMQGARDSFAQSPLHHKAPQHNRNTSNHHGQGPIIQVGRTGSGQHSGQVARFQESTQTAGPQRNCQVTGLQHGLMPGMQQRVSGSSVVYNYFQPRAPRPSGSWAPPLKIDQIHGNNRTLGNAQTLYGSQDSYIVGFSPERAAKSDF